MCEREERESVTYWLAEHEEWLAESKCNWGTENEPASIQATNTIYIQQTISIHEDVYDLLEHLRILQEPSNVIESGDALEGEVRDNLCDLTRLSTVLNIYMQNGVM
jgi:hypothetical protein